MEWKNLATDEPKCVSVYMEAATKWDNVALCLGLSPGQILGIRNEPGNDMMKMSNVFDRWFSNADSLPNKKKYPKKWSGLIRLLIASQLGELSKKVKEALSAPFSDIRDNLEY